MKKFMIALWVSAIFITASVIPAGAGQSNISEPKPPKSNPIYSSKARYSDEGMENDRFYTFSDGEINPKFGEPLLMVNGTFYANTPVIRENTGTLHVPMRAVAEAFGADVSWSEEEKKIIIRYDDLTVELVKSPYVAYEIFVSNKEGRQGYLEPVFVDDQLYVSVLFFTKYFDLNIGYMTGHEAYLGFEVAYNPIIWLESLDTYSLYDEASTEVLRDLKIWLAESLEKCEIEFSGTEYEGGFEFAKPRIAEDMETIKYVGQAGRYAVYKCPYILLVDMDTRATYVYKPGNGFGGIHEADANGYNVFLYGYIVD